MDRVPTRWNLSCRGVEVGNILFLVCLEYPEVIDHVLWKCATSMLVWEKVFAWLDFEVPLVETLGDVF